MIRMPTNVVVTDRVSRTDRDGHTPGERDCRVDQRKTPFQGRLSRTLRICLLVCLVVGVPLAQPAAAQESNPICQDESNTLVEMIEGFVQITTGLGIMGLLVVWQAESLMEMFTLDQQRKTDFKRHKQSAMKSAGILILLGPLFTLAGSAMSLPIAECVTLMPF